MTNIIELKDVFRMNPQIMNVDQTNSAEKGVPRSLIIDLAISHSCKVINNRVYTPRGQARCIDSWTTPFSKPILLYHQSDKDPIGRIIETRYESMDAEASKFFSSPSEFAKFKADVDTDDPKKIYKALRRHNLLDNKKWPGLGRIVGRAKIVDQEAVPKFLDSRYLTFSAGSHTDRYVCGICGIDWAKGKICEHIPGQVDEDGNLAVFITGSFYGDEVSVVNPPADGYAQVLSMAFADSEHRPSQVIELMNAAQQQSTDAIYVVDSKIYLGDDMNIDSNKIVEVVPIKDVRNLVGQLFQETLEQSVMDALEAKSHYEVMWLVRLHDALHSEYDWQVRYEDSSKIPVAVFKMHQDLMELADSRGFRDSIVNGNLDNFDAAGTETKTEDQVVVESTTDATEVAEDAEVVKAVDTIEAAEPVVEVQETQETQETQVVETTEASKASKTSDTIEAPKAVDSTVLAIADIEAKLLQTLITKFDSLKESLSNGKEKENDKEATKGMLDIQQDYTEALKTIDALNAKLNDLEVENKNLQNRLAESVPKYDSIQSNGKQQVGLVENPSIDSAQNKDAKVKPSGYEKSVIDAYRTIEAEKGGLEASRYIDRQVAKGFLPRTFNIINYID